MSRIKFGTPNKFNLRWRYPAFGCSLSVYLKNPNGPEHPRTLGLVGNLYILYTVIFNLSQP
jgi:hypothetical protein